MLDAPLLEYAKRDAGIAQVLGHSDDWASLCLIEMKEFKNLSKYHSDYPNGFTMRHIRTWLTPLIGEPNHPNGWSALAMKLLRAGLIEDTGAIARLGDHARKQPVYRWA